MQSSTIQMINSCPDYISTFINKNIEDLNKIYNENYEIYKEKDENFDKGILLFNCSQKDNIMNVQFADEVFMETIITKESVKSLINNIPTNKKLLFIMDLDINSVFLINI